MPAQIYERSDVSGGPVSKANPEANHRCEGWTLYGGVESWQGFPHEHPAPGTGKRVKRKQCERATSMGRSEAPAGSPRTRLNER
ncbi:MAG: hypothetical protein A2Y72_03555 [Chloroflexi bacterium RBG_13_53_26]|nr:MAG: hypothetical protein A2Y72_03555 [Chloroflexi bacterium RBG_13_53_26]